MASAVLRECGFEDTNLGTDTPVDVIADAAEDEHPRLVWLTVSNPLQSRRQYREIERLATTVNGYGGTIVVGGRSAAMYEWPLARHASSMVELSLIAGQLVASMDAAHNGKRAAQHGR